MISTYTPELIHALGTGTHYTRQQLACRPIQLLATGERERERERERESERERECMRVGEERETYIQGCIIIIQHIMAVSLISTSIIIGDMTTIYDHPFV